MAESLNLPPHVKPLWIEALFTSEYERDTLPLLFASDKVYQDYYASLRTKNPNLSLAIDQIRERNSLARMERQEGMWMECVDSLLYCTTLRRAVFDESDFQFTAAQKHHIMSLLNFATFFLRESSNAKTREAMLMRSYELFKKAEEAVAHVRGREDRYFLKTAIENNYAVYFAKRKKYCAAAQRITMALRAWTPLQIPEHQFYFAVQKSSGDLWSGRVDDAVIGLKHATMHVTKKKFETVTSPPRQRNDQDFSDDSDASSSDEDAVVVAPVRGGAGGAAPHAPFRYNIHVLNSGLDAGVASCIAVFHNLAIALIAQRRYKEAIGWITKSLEVVAAQSSQLVATHPIVVTVRHAEEFCQKMSMGTKMSTFKMKRDDHSSEQYRNMQAAVLKSREPQRLQADGSEGPVKKSPSPPSRARSAHCPRFRKPTHVEALQTYLKNVSYRQLVEEFGFEDPKVVHARSPPSRGASQKASPARMVRENSNAEHHDRDLTSANSESEASPARDQHSSASTSRRSSPRSSRASSRASSVEPADGPQAPPVEEAVTQPIVAATPVQTQGQPAAEDAPAKAQPLPGEATGPSTQAAVLAEESAVELPAESSSTAQGEPPAVETETAAQSSGPPVSKQSVVEPHAEPEQAPVQAEPPAAAEAEPPAAAEAEPPEATEAEAPAAAEAEPPAATEAEAPAATEAEAPAAAEAEPPAATEAEAPAAPQPPSIPPVEPEGHSGTDVAPPVAASSPQQKPSGDATYGDDDFESASEANSPVKVPRALNNTSEYANDFENTADSTFSPLAPRTEDAPTVETSAVEPPDAVAAEPPANVTYGEDEFEDDA